MSSIEMPLMNLYQEPISQGLFTPAQQREIAQAAIRISRAWDGITLNRMPSLKAYSGTPSSGPIQHGTHGCGGEATQVIARVGNGDGKYFSVKKVSGKKCFASFREMAVATLTFDQVEAMKLGLQNLKAASFIFWHVVTVVFPAYRPTGPGTGSSVGYQQGWSSRQGIVLDTWAYNVGITKRAYPLSEYLREYGSMVSVS